MKTELEVIRDKGKVTSPSKIKPGISGPMQVMTGNDAAARVAYRLSEVIAIYPITPSSPMGESSDEWAAAGKPNLFGQVPKIVEMQSEAGAAGAVHGALQAGSLTTTFTSSQGLLLMIPNMYKIAGELTSAVIHVAARSLAASALSIFGDHSDVMAAKATGWGMLFGSSVQEAQDMAVIAHAATLKSRLPFLNIFDGFRTSHELNKIELVTDEQLRSMISAELIREHRLRALTPDAPVIRGTAQNPDVYFQSREAVNPFYLATPHIVEEEMRRFAKLTGREYHLFDYVGHPEAERIIVLMGSGVGAVEEVVSEMLQVGEKVGLVKVRLYRPFSAEHLVKAIPETAQTVAVLDRTKEPGSIGEPLYQDVLTALAEKRHGAMPKVIGGRYGLSSKEFTPPMVKAIYKEMLSSTPKNHFTIGINDDVTMTSIDYDPAEKTNKDDVLEAVFWGLGSDGTVSANQSTAKIIGEETPLYAQGYFVYDSKKSGAITTSHLRFGQKPIESTYQIEEADFVGVHQFNFIGRYNVLELAGEGAVVLLNSPYSADQVWEHLPEADKATIREKNLTLYVIDAYRIAREAGLGPRINTVMQTGFFALTDLLSIDEAIEKMKEQIRKNYGSRGEKVIAANFAAVDSAAAGLEKVDIPEVATNGYTNSQANGKGTSLFDQIVPADAPAFVREVTAPIMAGKGDELPVSMLPFDGTFPVGTTKWEKRNIAEEVPVWDPDACIQCGKCVLVCPHAAIRANVVPTEALEGAPEGFLTADARWRGLSDHKYTLQVAMEDCTGCALCYEACPVLDKSDPAGKRRALNMQPQHELVEQGAKTWDFFTKLPAFPRTNGTTFNTIKDVQLLEPLFEFSGACSGCGETPYLKLLSQLYGDHLLVANATGCSSIYGGNLPTTPWTKNQDGRGPAWSNSLFEDNAEFGLGMRLSLDQQNERALYLLQKLRPHLDEELVEELLQADQSTDAGIEAQRERVALLKDALFYVAEAEEEARADADELKQLADALVKKSVWIVGGDGWAYDIGYGGVDHVLASGEDVNILVLDTEVYSNTGGQASKSTPRGAVAKFAAQGKRQGKKDLGAIAMQYGHVYVATVAMGASDRQTLQAFKEAAAYPGPSLIIAYSHCIAHRIDMQKGLDQQDLAVKTGHWPLYRYDPRLAWEGKNPLKLDSKEPSVELEEYLKGEGRFRTILSSKSEGNELLLAQAKADVANRWNRLKDIADKS